MAKRNLSQAASNAADKFFTAKNEMAEESKIDNVESVTNINCDTIITNDTDDTPVSNNTDITNNNNVSDINNNTNNTKDTHVTNKSKHYDTRGKRSERFGILLDKQLKEDLQLLCNATNNRSLNDFIVTVLLEYVEEPRNRERLAAYKELLKL